MGKFHRTQLLALLPAALLGCAPPANETPAVNDANVSAAAASAASVPQLVRPDGSYPTKPLEKDAIVVKVIQNGVTNLQEAETIEQGLEANLAKMIALANQACSEGGKPDFLLYNEFPLTGYSTGTRDEKLKFTIEIPGPETERLGEVARDCDTYIIFGSYARDPEWPGHILSINAVIGRNGEVAEKFWKTRNIKRLTPDGEIPTTTIESVRDKYRAAVRDRGGVPGTADGVRQYCGQHRAARSVRVRRVRDARRRDHVPDRDAVLGAGRAGDRVLP